MGGDARRSRRATGQSAERCKPVFDTPFSAALALNAYEAEGVEVRRAMSTTAAEIDQALGITRAMYRTSQWIAMHSIAELAACWHPFPRLSPGPGHEIP